MRKHKQTPIHSPWDAWLFMTFLTRQRVADNKWVSSQTNASIVFLALPPISLYLLASSVPCIVQSHLEMWCKLRRCIQTREMIRSLTHKPHYIFQKNSHHIYLSWHFHIHSEIHCRATSIFCLYYFLIILFALHDHRAA